MNDRRSVLWRPNNVYGLTLVLLIVGTLGGCATTTNPDSSSRSDSLLDVAPDEDESPSAETMYSMARLLARKENLEQAERVYLQSIEKYPVYAPAYCGLAEILLIQGRLEEATAILTAGVEKKPDDAILLNNLGVCSLLKGEYDSALTYFEEADRATPYRRRYQANVALAKGLLGRSAEAAEEYERVLSKSETEHNLKIIREMTSHEGN